MNANTASTPNAASQNPHGDFSASWLSLREPADHRSRPPSCHEQLLAWRQQYSTLNIIDLGSGSGSGLRYLMPRLGHHQLWTLVDNDAQLLSALPEKLQLWNKNNAIKADISVQHNHIDIYAEHFSAQVQLLQADLSSALPELPFSKAHLVTASALLDLTSAQWIEQLAALCIEHQCAALFALNYNGQIQWQPNAENDCHITALLNQHQCSDKGLGLALGPGAGDYFARIMTAQGRHSQTFNSPWILTPNDLELQTELLKGWAVAATEQSPEQADNITRWLSLRMAHIESGLSHLQVGHMDLLSLT